MNEIIWVFHKVNVSHIVFAQVCDFRCRKDKSREIDRSVLSRKAVLFHCKQQEIGEVFLCVEFEIVEKGQLAFFLNYHVKVTVVDLDEHPSFNVVFHDAVDEDTT